MIAIVATLNTILAQMTMAARVIYGMARQGDLPRFAGHVHPKTATPLVATGLIVAATLTLALLVPFERLAEGTSIATLIVFALVNLSLLRLRHRKVTSPGPHVHVPVWVPAAGFIVCVAMMATATSASAEKLLGICALVQEFAYFSIHLSLKTTCATAPQSECLICIPPCIDKRCRPSLFFISQSLI